MITDKVRTICDKLYAYAYENDITLQNYTLTGVQCLRNDVYLYHTNEYGSTYDIGMIENVDKILTDEEIRELDTENYIVNVIYLFAHRFEDENYQMFVWYRESSLEKAVKYLLKKLEAEENKKNIYYIVNYLIHEAAMQDDDAIYTEELVKVLTIESEFKFFEEDFKYVTKR